MSISATLSTCCPNKSCRNSSPAGHYLSILSGVVRGYLCPNLFILYIYLYIYSTEKIFLNLSHKWMHRFCLSNPSEFEKYLFHKLSRWNVKSHENCNDCRLKRTEIRSEITRAFFYEKNSRYFAPKQCTLKCNASAAQMLIYELCKLNLDCESTFQIDLIPFCAK